MTLHVTNVARTSDASSGSTDQYSFNHTLIEHLYISE